MNKEQKVISQPLAKKINDKAKEIGFELPESEMWWGNTIGQKDQTCWRLYTKEVKEIPDTAMEYYPAYDTSELGEMLPTKDTKFAYSFKEDKTFCCIFVEESKWTIEQSIEEKFTGKTEAEARGKMYFYLLDNNLL